MCPGIIAWLQVQVSHGASGPFLRSVGLGKGFLEEAQSGKVHSGRPRREDRLVQSLHGWNKHLYLGRRGLCGWVRELRVQS